MWGPGVEGGGRALEDVFKLRARVPAAGLGASPAHAPSGSR